MIKKIALIDKQISNALLSIKNSLLLTMISKIGGVVFCSLLLVLIILIPQPEKFTLLCNLGLSLALTTAVVFILKYTIRRQRVLEIKDTFIKKYDPYSFPSGHISRLSAFIIPFFPNIPVILAFTAMALISAYARLSRGYHYFSDVTAGALIGLVCGYISLIINKLFLVKALLSVPFIKYVTEWLFIF